jgi:hypothetical protein
MNTSLPREFKTWLELYDHLRPAIERIEAGHYEGLDELRRRQKVRFNMHHFDPYAGEVAVINYEYEIDFIKLKAFQELEGCRFTIPQYRALLKCCVSQHAWVEMGSEAWVAIQEKIYGLVRPRNADEKL